MHKCGGVVHKCGGVVHKCGGVVHKCNNNCPCGIPLSKGALRAPLIDNDDDDVLRFSKGALQAPFEMFDGT